MSIEKDNWEKQVIDCFNKDGWQLEWTGGSYEHYDGKGLTPKGFSCIIELKQRHDYYYAKLLEIYKYEKLMELDMLKFYFVEDIKGNYLFLLDGLVLPKKEELICSKTTEFENNDKVNKGVYLLNESKAVIVNKF
jgi:hypothetical protein